MNHNIFLIQTYNLHTILTHYLSQRILTIMIKGFTESQQLRRYSLLYSQSLANSLQLFRQLLTLILFTVHINLFCPATNSDNSQTLRLQYKQCTIIAYSRFSFRSILVPVEWLQLLNCLRSLHSQQPGIWQGKQVQC